MTQSNARPVRVEILEGQFRRVYAGARAVSGGGVKGTERGGYRAGFFQISVFSLEKNRANHTDSTGQRADRKCRSGVSCFSYNAAVEDNGVESVSCVRRDEYHAQEADQESDSSDCHQ
jgi:hypothetical protein